MLTERYSKHAFPIAVLNKANEALPEREKSPCCERSRKKASIGKQNAICFWCQAIYTCNWNRMVSNKTKMIQMNQVNCCTLLSFKLLEVILSLENLIGIGLNCLNKLHDRKRTKSKSEVHISQKCTHTSESSKNYYRTQNQRKRYTQD